MRLSLRGQGVLLAGLLFLIPMTASAGDGVDGDRSTKVDRLDKKAQRAIKRAARKARKEARQAVREAKKKKQEPIRQARAYRNLQVSENLQARVDKLTTELTWHDSLEGARKAAREQNKPILWVQALGDLRGVL